MREAKERGNIKTVESPATPLSAARHKCISFQHELTIHLLIRWVYHWYRHHHSALDLSVSGMHWVQISLYVTDIHKQLPFTPLADAMPQPRNVWPERAYSQIIVNSLLCPCFTIASTHMKSPEQPNTMHVPRVYLEPMYIFFKVKLVAYFHICLLTVLLSCTLAPHCHMAKCFLFHCCAECKGGVWLRKAPAEICLSTFPALAGFFTVSFL